jgi:hypothetical protein
MTEQRQCRKCNIFRPSTDFYGNSTICKYCHGNKAKDRRTKIRTDNLKRVLEYLLAHPCVDCGEKDPVVLEFDHVRGEKRFTIGSHLWLPWNKIKSEIDKCDVRCSNCHKRRHAKENGTFMFKLSNGSKD